MNLTVPEQAKRTPVLDSVQAAVADLRAGRPVIVVDDEDRENEGGLICAPVAPEVADRMRLPLMVQDNEDPEGTAYTVSIDAKNGIESGISAADRARTLRVLADPASTPQDVRRPGHVFPLRARAGGLTERRGHTEAAVELMRLAGSAPVAVISEVCDEDGGVARLPQLRAFADQRWLKLVSIEQLAAFAPESVVAL